MFEAGLVFSAISIIAVMVCISLSLYVLIRNPHLKSSRVFVLLTLMAILTDLTDFFMITASDEGTALAFARPTIFFSTITVATMLYLTSFLPYERKGSWLVRHKREFTLIIVFTAVVPTMLVSTVAEDKYGWWVSTGLPMVWWFVVIYAYFFVGAIILARLYLTESMEGTRRRIAILTAGMVIPFFLGLMVALIKAYEPSAPPLFSATILASSLTFAYGIFRQKLFILEPAQENLRAVKEAPIVEPRHSVLVKAKSGDLAYQMFVNELASGGQGLLITRKHPDQVKEAYGLMNTPILWLTHKPGPDSIDPANISVLQHTTLKFLQRGNGPVILIDGLEHLASYNRLEKVLPFVFELRDATIVSESKLIIALDPETLASRDLSLLERDLDIISE